MGYDAEMVYWTVGVVAWGLLIWVGIGVYAIFFTDKEIK